MENLEHNNVTVYKFTVLEHNLFKKLSKGTTLLWKTQIQTIENGLNDTIVGCTFLISESERSRK